MKVYGEAEIARILQLAADLQERSDAIPSAPGHGLTLTDLRQVAKEAGIDPRFVDIAAARSEGLVGQRGSRLFGRQRWHFHSEIPGNLDDGARSRLVESIRSVMNEDGEVVEVFGRLEWRHDDSLGPVSVGISENEDATMIDVSASRRGEAGFAYGFGVPAGGLLGGSVVAGMVGVAGTALALPIAIAMAGVSYWVVRLGWVARSSWWERHLQRKIERLSSTVQEMVLSNEAPEDDA
jgi:hypothetical protein